ncbi:GNAT family N-acetyltransferase [Rhodospirillaceae bacterium SYSU D60014]|uniref:GNAT family N-acetyltransferase n=1 Tax=Virgifigura deserti TaxID=2268457 RepID=UPI000E663BB7
MTQPCLIRPAAPRDGAAILSFQRAAISRIPDDIYAQPTKEAWWRTPAVGFDEILAGGRYFVAESDGRPVAGAGWSPCTGLPDAAMIRAVFVHPDHGACGLGRRLVHSAEDAAVTAGFSDILVSAALTSIGFYEKLGYEAAKTVSIEVEKGVWIGCRKMWKRLVRGCGEPDRSLDCANTV